MNVIVRIVPPVEVPVVVIAPQTSVDPAVIAAAVIPAWLVTAIVGAVVWLLVIWPFAPIVWTFNAPSLAAK